MRSVVALDPALDVALCRAWHARRFYDAVCKTCQSSMAISML
jgi:hypothetical protein